MSNEFGGFSNGRSKVPIKIWIMYVNKFELNILFKIINKTNTFFHFHIKNKITMKGFNKHQNIFLSLCIYILHIPIFNFNAKAVKKTRENLFYRIEVL